MQKQETHCQGILLCVDSYENGVLCGRFYRPGSKSCCSFHSMSQFLWKMDQTLDHLAFPQSFNARRTFGQAPSSPGPVFSETTLLEGAAATFSIRVLFRQNASWQGSVRWLEGRQEQSFRSALELIFLIDSVLTGREDREVV